MDCFVPRNDELSASRHCEEERRSNLAIQEWIASYLAMTKQPTGGLKSQIFITAGKRSVTCGIKKQQDSA
ncbi:MAG: hypothetical protein LBR81_01055 [Prevotellaceae bacterium]|nr:hypothetical protein [Prevotellaceae bacterium]